MITLRRPRPISCIDIFHKLMLLDFIRSLSTNHCKAARTQRQCLDDAVAVANTAIASGGPRCVGKRLEVSQVCAGINRESEPLSARCCCRYCVLFFLRFRKGDLHLGFLVHGFVAGRELSFFAAPAAPATQTVFPIQGPARGPPA